MSMKEAYQKKLQARLDEWDAEIRKLKAKADSAKADIQIDYHKQLTSLEAKRKEAADKLAELEEASEDAWVDLKAGVELAWDSLADALNSARSRFK